MQHLKSSPGFSVRNVHDTATTAPAADLAEVLVRLERLEK